MTKLGRHTQRQHDFLMARPQGSDVWEGRGVAGYGNDISKGLGVLIPSPSLQVVRWMRRKDKITGTLIPTVF